MMKFRKIPTLVLLFGVMVISLLFSALCTTKEGVEMKNPTAVDIQTIQDILDDNAEDDAVSKNIQKMKVSKTMKKIIAIRPFAMKYTALNDIYTSNAKLYLDALATEIKTTPQTKSDGSLVDENAMSSENRDKAKAILLSSDYSNAEKIEKIATLIGKDSNIKSIVENHESSWIQMIQNYIVSLNATTSDNAAIAKKTGAY